MSLVCEDCVELSQKEWNPDRVFVDAVKRSNRMAGNDQILAAVLRVDGAMPELVGVLKSIFSFSLNVYFFGDPRMATFFLYFQYNS